MRGIAAQCIHGDLGQKVREKVLSFFRAGQLRVLVATDVAAGGWTSTTWTGSSIMIFRKRGNTMSTALGGPARAKHQGAAYNLISSVTDDVRLDEIIRNNQYDVKTITL